MTVVRPPTRVSPAPRPLRRRKTTLGNIVLVPASLLPFKAQWQAIANALPRGEVLVITPPMATPQRHATERVAAQLRARGWRVTAVPVKPVA